LLSSIYLSVRSGEYHLRWRLPGCGSRVLCQSWQVRFLPLAAVRIALDGRVDEAIKTIEGAEKRGRYRLLIGFLILVAIAAILTGGKFGFSNIQSAALILIIITVFCMHLLRKSHRVAHLLDAEDQSVTLNMTGSGTGQTQLREGTSSEVSAADVVARASITEQSTR